ncbi:RBBP9/YdeN family alpha/beta hydrolase [Pseudothauera hydrothermalis]|uniref:RBBP9/YdeN family alpha/beta hydrolase n=1 Tax=Pseudothauera hydrothermalis TaxID=2184083 RepID=UPI000E09C826|nr:alpha/beta hydrolase [Pseudothauera hydrothermalis]
MTPVRLLMLPGIGNSGPEHWQTLWASPQQNGRGFQPADWDRPQLDDWLAALDAAIDEDTAPVVLVAHSLACLLVAHWALPPARNPDRDNRIARVRGAFLVAVPDPEAPAFPSAAREFARPLAMPLPFPALVVASLDDPYGSMAYARRMAMGWAAGCVEVGAYGHINVVSAVGAWETGWHLLQAFGAGLRVRVAASPSTGFS